MDKRAYGIPDVVKETSFGRTRIYEEMRAGRLRAVKLGRRTVVLATDLDAWLRNLAERQPAQQSDQRPAQQSDQRLEQVPKGRPRRRGSLPSSAPTRRTA